MATVLANATLASLDPLKVESGNVVIADGLIKSVGQLPLEGGHQVVDCAGRLLMPGNVCSHTHLYSALARGMPGPRKVPTNFPEILEEIWWKLDRSLDEPSTWSSAAVGALDAARAGTTTLIDHHASPNFIDGCLDVLADAISQVGLRAVLCYEVTDRGGPERCRAGLRENERFLRENKISTVKGMVGAHASFTLEDSTLRELHELADALDAGIHIHVAEDEFDEEDSFRRCGQRTVHRLDEASILSSKSIAAHCVHVDDGELEVLRNRKAWIAHNCRSNMNNSVGYGPVAKFGGRAVLGTDGIDGDMIAESRAAYFRAREASLSAYAEQLTGMLARGSELASQFFPQPIGRLEEGSTADLVVLDYDPPSPLSAENLAWHWMFAMTAQNVRSVMVNGDWVIRDGQFCRVDEEKVRAEARIQAPRVWDRMGKLF
jgi:putative selenium metabolism protein SsnA